jgi:hypothetical protein
VYSSADMCEARSGHTGLENQERSDGLAERFVFKAVSPWTPRQRLPPGGVSSRSAKFISLINLERTIFVIYVS